MNNSYNKMICLDLIRIYACFSVVAVHVAIVFNIPGRIGQFMSAGSNGLGIFYILSGFLIFASLESNKGSLLQWYKKRMLRILPMYYLTIVVFIVLYECIIGGSPEDPIGLKWISYFLGINTILPKTTVFWYNLASLSSMSVFVWFYILAPLLKRVVTNWNRAWVFVLAAYVVMKALGHTNWLQMFGAYYYFAIGILIYYAIGQKKEKQTVIVLACISALLLLADAKGGLLYALVIGILIIMTYDCVISNDLVAKIITFISNRTFAIYLAHATVVQIMWVTYDCKKGITGFVIGTILTIVVTALLYEGVEKGTVKLYKKLAK